MAESFSASAKGWSEKQLRNIDRIFKQSSVDVLEDIQTPIAHGGRMPVDTGFLRNSLVVNGHGGQTAYTAAIAYASPGQPFDCSWSAEYALDQEYGSRGRPPKFFVRGGLMKWESIVKENARKVGK